MGGRGARATAALAALLALCLPCGRAAAQGGPAAAAPAAQQSRVRLRWIGHWLGEDRREDLVREIKREYEFLHPGTEVDLVFNKELAGPEADHKRKAAAEIVRMVRTGKIDWDVVFLDVAVFEFVSEALGGTSWAARHLVDFAAVPGFLESQEEFIRAEPRYRERMGGIFTGPWIENYLHNLWYNTEVARRAGIVVKERGMTAEDLVGYAEQLARHNRERGTSTAFLKLSSWNRVDALFEQLFKSQFDDFAAAVAPPFSEEKGRAFLATLEIFERLSRHQPLLNAGWQRLTSDDFKRQFLLEDDALFIVGGTFMYSQFRGVSRAAAEKARPVEDPRVRRANGLVGDYTPAFAVMRDSPHRDAAVDLVMSWAQPKNANKWVRYTKNLTGCRSFMTELGADEAGSFDDVYERYLVDMKTKHRGLPVMNFRGLSVVFGERNPVPVVELRERLAAILEGRLTARAYYQEVMGRFAAARGGTD